MPGEYSFAPPIIYTKHVMRIAIKAAFKTAALLAAVVLTASCGGQKAVRQDMPAPLERPVVEAGDVTIGLLKAGVIFNTVSALRSEVSLKMLRKGELAGTYQGLLVYSAPDQLAVRVFGPLGITVADMVLRERVMQVFVPIKNTLFEGEMSAISDIKERFQGDGAFFAIEETGNAYVLLEMVPGTADSGANALDITGKYAFDRMSLLNTSITRFKDRKPSLELLFGEFGPISGSDRKLPMLIQASFKNGLGIEMRLIGPEIPNEPQDEFFMLKSHEGRDVKPLSDLFRRGL